MKIVILGAGRRGLRLAKRLSEEKHDVTLIDADEGKISIAQNRFDCIGYVANGKNVDDLRECGIEGADAFVALTGDDEVNLVACALVKNAFGVETTIASSRNVSYSSIDTGTNLLGITQIVNTDFEVASAIFEEIESGMFSDTINFRETGMKMYNYVVEHGSPLCNMTVQDFRKEISADCLIAAINRKDEAIVPSGKTEIKAGDTLSIVAAKALSLPFLSLSAIRSKPRKIAIVGATQAARILLKRFPEKQQSRFAVIDRDMAECENFVHEFPEALVINANITDEGIFDEEELNKYGLMIVMTDSDELNIIIANYAKQEGVRSTLAVINKNNNYLRLSRNTKIDSMISAQDVTVDSITRFLHSRHITSLHSLFDGKIEVFEYKIAPGCKMIGKQLKDINMQGRGIIAGVTKNDKKATGIIPGGRYTIEEGDLLVLIVHQESAVSVVRMFE